MIKKSTRKFRVPNAATRDEAIHATGVPQIGEVGCRGTVVSVDTIQNGKCWLLTVNYEKEIEGAAPETPAEE